MSITYTPMLEQYREIKKKHNNEILFFRLGDFYEMFFEDAELAANELEITLTSREGGQNHRIPMCGIPYHAAENYIAKLINKGYKVAICEQVEDPKLVKGLVKREVVKIITPGTVLSDALLADASNNYLAALYEEEGVLYLASADISTGECMWAMFSGSSRQEALFYHLFHLMPAEVVLTSKIQHLEELTKFIDTRLNRCSTTTYMVDDYKSIMGLTEKHFTKEELPDNSGASTVVACLLNYLHQTVKNDLSHINHLVKYNSADHLIIDTATLRNLEITRNMRDGSKRDTLLSVLDFTRTAMGGRLLKKWLEYPLINCNDITQRQDVIAELLEKLTVRQTIGECLKEIYDFERILTRLEVGTANARDLVALASSLKVIPTLKTSILDMNSRMFSKANMSIKTHTDVLTLIESAIADNPPLSIREGGMIKAGYDLELDELRSISHSSKQWIQNLETDEREKTGIKSLKVGFNKVFGYYLEVTHTHAASVPPNYVRKQTLANAERYITPELKEFENKVLGAQEKIVNIEYHLFTKVREYIKAYIKDIQETARHIAEIDALLSLSEAAVRYNYVRPAIDQKRQIRIKDGRHPVVERLLVREMFVPNDTELNNTDSEIIVITGPNMAGKSTYMRQVALLVLMAQVGSFIPAREAVISPVDRIFTRVGASDDLSTGQSTFMVEMNEVALILKHATSDSLVILDEIGRGTSTFDGMSIARAVIEYIKERIKAKTLFATHYHELIELADEFSGIKNYSVAVKERGNDVVFLRRIIAGGADKSYGIHVAQLAGLPKKTIERAQRILAELEAKEPDKQQKAAKSAAKEDAAVISLFSNTIVNELMDLDVLSITPLEALNILYKLKNQAKEEAGRL